MSILDFRMFIAFMLVIITVISIISFLVRKNVIAKIVTLLFIYILTILFLIYLMIIKESQDLIFPVISIFCINFILTSATGLGILNNVLRNEEEEEEDY